MYYFEADKKIVYMYMYIHEWDVVKVGIFPSMGYPDV